jgi:tetratricopeptide (TPR) repeat protein
VASGAGPEASSGSGPADALLAEGRRRYEAGDLADAEPLARRAVELLPAGTLPFARAVAVQLAGECAFSLGRYVEARALADEALALRADAPEADRAESLNLRGIVDLSLGDAGAGHERVAAALAMREAALGPDDPDTIESLNNTGVALARVGRMDDAVAAHEDALRRCERAFTAPHRQLAVTCNALAVKLDREEATRDRAAALYERALAAAEAALGPEHPMVATLLSNIGTGRLNAGDVEAARPLLERAVDLHERRHGATHPNTATALLSLSAVRFRDGRLVEARVLAERALAIRFGAFGARDRRTREALVQAVLVLGALLPRDPSVRGDAIALFGVNRDLAPAPLAVDLVRFGAARPSSGEAALRAYLARAAERNPVMDPAVRRAMDRARTAAVAADAALMAGQLDVAAVAATEAVALVEGARGPMGLDLVEPLHRAAAVERARGEPRRALALDRRAFDILAAAYGERHPFVLHALARLAIETGGVEGSAAGRRDLERLRGILADAEPGGLAAHLRDVVDRRLADIGAGPGRSGRRRPD